MGKVCVVAPCSRRLCSPTTAVPTTLILPRSRSRRQWEPGAGHVEPHQNPHPCIRQDAAAPDSPPREAVGGRQHPPLVQQRSPAGVNPPELDGHHVGPGVGFGLMSPDD